MRLFSAALIVSLGLTAGMALAHDPTGETADYVIDRNSARTSSMILGGNGTVTVLGPATDSEGKAVYDVQLRYKAKVILMGEKEGVEDIQIDREFFEPEFMAKLRAEGQYSSESFKIKHLGYRDARNMDGGVYPHCDYVLFYDIKTREPLEDFLVWIGSALGGLVSSGDVQDVKVYAHIKEGVPVLGAVKMDASAVVKGNFIKAGVDYKRP